MGFNMRPAVLLEHREYFRQHRYIEFEELLSSSQVESLHKNICNVVGRRIGGYDCDAMPRVSHEKLFMAGRDIWRDDEAIRKIVFRFQLAEVAAELMKERSLRIAYDQLFFPERWKLADDEERCLAEVSCFRGLTCALILCVSPPSSPLLENETLLPTQPGSGVYFDVKMPLSFPECDGKNDAEYFMVVYAKPLAFYKKQDNDPHTHALKRLGYVFGDKLREELHPSVCR